MGCAPYSRLRTHQMQAMFEEERAYLQPLPVRSMQYFRDEQRTVCDDGGFVAVTRLCQANAVTDSPKKMSDALRKNH